METGCRCRPCFTPVPTLVPVSETNNETKQESTASSTPRWQRVDAPGSGSAPSGPVRWAQAPTSPNPTPTPIKPQQPPKPQAIARSVGRAFSYGGVLYPEVGFWVPTAFRQDVARRFVLTYQLLGNPTNTGSLDAPNWNDFWNVYSDGQYQAEFTPLIMGPISAGITFSQQESFVGNRSDGNYRDSGASIGFQVKSSLSPTTGFAIVGQNQE